MDQLVDLSQSKTSQALIPIEVPKVVVDSPKRGGELGLWVIFLLIKL